MPKRALNPLAGLLAAVCVPAVAVAQKPSPLPASAELHHWLGVEHHLRRSLDEASREYARALEIEPARPLTPEELAIVRRFAPRVYTTPDEPFPLKDFAAVLHPARRIVAYHFFWEDDIDFPDDNDPCDHELMWVEYSADGRAVEGIWMYFHGRLLPGGEAALDDARRHGMRPRVNVQWGKHGSMPAGWETLAIRADAGDVEVRHLALDRPITLAQYNEGTHRKLAGEGRRREADGTDRSRSAGGSSGAGRGHSRARRRRPGDLGENGGAGRRRARGLRAGPPAARTTRRRPA